MVVWTIQPESLWLQLQRDGVLYGPRASEANFQEFRAAYDWIATQMGKRLGPRPRADRYPLWAWYQWGNAKQRRPDLRSVGHVGRGERGVRIEFDIDEQDILLSGFDEWHVVLNDGYLAVNEEDACAFDAAFASACKERGRAKAVSQFRKPIVSSWERIFDLDMDRFSQENYWADRADKPIQGTFWVLHLEQVRTVTFFTGR